MCFSALGEGALLKCAATEVSSSELVLIQFFSGTKAESVHRPLCHAVYCYNYNYSKLAFISLHSWLFIAHCGLGGDLRASNRLHSGQ